MKVTLSNRLIFEGAPPLFEQTLMRALTLQNPQWVENRKMGRWNGGIPEYLTFWQKTKSGALVVPRGLISRVFRMLPQDELAVQIDDQRRSLPELDFSFKGKLRPFQEDAVREALRNDFATLSAPTGSGKTVMALYLIAKRAQPAMVVVHTIALLRQWANRIQAFLGIPPRRIGIIGDGKRMLGEEVTVACVQSLFKCADQVAPQIGHLVVDECHRTPSRTFTEAVTAFDTKYMLGLSATPWRRDKLSRLIFWHVGDVVHSIEKEGLVETGDVLDMEIVLRETAFKTSFDPSEEYPLMLSELTRDRSRNALIVSDVAQEASNGGGVCLVLSDRKAHCEELRRLLAEQGIPSELLTGDQPGRLRQAVVDRVNRGRVKVLIATCQLIGEGFDCRALSTLFLVTPIRFSGRLLQYVGRVLRSAPGKDRAKVYDYVDTGIGVLSAAAKHRLRTYGAVNRVN